MIMQRLMNLFLIAMFVGISTFTIPFALKVGSNKNHSSQIEMTMGTIEEINNQFIKVRFDNKIVNGCDATILAFIHTPNGSVIALKPILLPAEEAARINKVIVFSMIDVAHLINISGEYDLKVYVENECSFLDHSTISIPAIKFEL